MIAGGGIAGMQSALDLADSGFKVYLVDSSPTIGGAMSQLDKTFPTNDCAMCIMAPKLVETGRHHNIELLTNSSIKDVKGEAGNFTIKVTKTARRVREDKCTGCGICTLFCPIEVPDSYNKGMKLRKAIYVRYPQAVPPTHTIDMEHCIGCGICESQCKANAIEYAQSDEERELNVGAIIVSPGFDEFNLELMRREYGFGLFPNVISSPQLERMLSATGPYRGLVLRPSDGKMPKKVAFIQCVGSRDRSIGNPYCSSVCCMFAIKEAVIAQEHNQGLQAHIFFMDMRAYGKEFDDYYIRAEQEHGILFTRNNRIADVSQDPKTQNLILNYIKDGEMKSEEFDLVVLSVGMVFPKDAKNLAEKFGINLNEFNFCDTDIFNPTSTNIPGIFVAGAFEAPKDIPGTVAQASGAAAHASALVSGQRDTLVVEKTFPEEIDIGGQDPRIGVFVCHCGINIGGVVDVPEVVEYVKTLPNVVYAEHNLYTCSQDTQEKIKQIAQEQNLNRVIVASCTPRTHGPLFQNTIRGAGLNPYLFEMANIRDQCSWVHMHEPDKATDKAKALVRMAVARARLLEPLPKSEIEISPSAIIIGGGVTGMNAALMIAEEGYDAYLIEKTDKLGGIVNRLHYGLRGEDIRKYLTELKSKIDSNDKIKVYLNTTLENFSGFVGNYEAELNVNGNKETLKTGVVIVATGGKEYKPEEYMYGEHDRILTQLEFGELLNEGKVKGKEFVMIQCVGSREEHRPYCSRICCTHAIKNALKIRELHPDSKVYILFKDMRTYGFREIYYEDATREGVLFIRFDNETKPKVSKDGDGIKIEVLDHFIQEDVALYPDYLILSPATLPNEGNYDLAQMLKVPLSKDKFFLEAHMKLRPVEFATEGVFLAGLAHSPKFFNECISEANAAVSRACTVLSKRIMEAYSAISVVDEFKCIGCGTCEEICEYHAPSLVEKGSGKLVSEINKALCKGCGACAVACCNGAITTLHFKNDQILSMVESAAEELKRESSKPAEEAQTGASTSGAD
ncbi:MAG: CoB--CoM heterodisulfide reductase iron-sulfur subunit A family protein [Thermoplasmata archaeon]|nr:MAG: CoB--CoM heterodisulfide reductase iron-sulfur subunit A family protein [Thermoplasmata archaeon]